MPRIRASVLRMTALFLAAAATLLIVGVLATSPRWWRPVDVEVTVNLNPVPVRAWRSAEGTLLLEFLDGSGVFLINPTYSGMAQVASGEYLVAAGWAVWKSLPPRTMPVRANVLKTGWDPQVTVTSSDITFLLHDGRAVMVRLPG